MINENDPAAPVGAWGQQSTEGETIMMKYSAMFMAEIVGNNAFSCNANMAFIASKSVHLARTLIAELNKELEPI